ncbi:MAG: orotidine-5'-phosphate decarboxylase [bacterium]|nr:orotidine-5'-phosphate decarboxylase [Candidatus Margulisiibacteriota bacterium]
MTFQKKLEQAAKKNNSLLCVGLDIDLTKVPPVFQEGDNAILAFNQHVIEATKDLVCAYKPNIAFYERYGLLGLSSLIKTIELIQKLEIPVILDAKRGDIGNSSSAYADSIFKVFKADAVTVNPYMGHDSLKPFLEHKDKGVFVLCLTSNKGSSDFQTNLYKQVADKAKSWGSNVGLVVGATKPEQLKEIREIAPDSYFLIPGIGAQGGDLKSTLAAAGEKSIINASRSIIYAEDIRGAAQKLRDEINKTRSGGL